MRLVPLVVVLVVAACGGSPARTLPNGSPATIVSVPCAERLRPLRESLHRVAERAASGETPYEAYAYVVERAGAVFHNTPMGDLPDDCVEALAEPLSDAYFRYRDAHVRWRWCRLDRPPCTDDEMREYHRWPWGEAAFDLEQAEFSLP